MPHRAGVVGTFLLNANAHVTFDLGARGNGAHVLERVDMKKELDRLLDTIHTTDSKVLTLTADGRQLRCWRAMPKKFERHNVGDGDLVFSLEGSDAKLHRFFNALCDRMSGRVRAEEQTNVTIWEADSLGLAA